MAKVEYIIQTYMRTGSIERTARETGLSEKEVERILYNAGKYTPQWKVDEIIGRRRTTNWKGISRFFIIAVLLAFTAAIYVRGKYGKEALPEPIRNIVPGVAETVEFPASGTIRVTPDQECNAQLNITSPDDDSKYYIILSNDTTTIELYMLGSQTHDIYVPTGDYRIYFATGNRWLGDDILFGDRTTCFQMDGTIICNEYGISEYKFFYAKGSNGRGKQVNVSDLNKLKGG